MNRDHPNTLDPETVRAFGTRVDFGATAEDYAKHRAGFPARFFAELAARGLLLRDEPALDLGTGTGTVARGLARAGMKVIGLDPAASLLEQAKTLAAAEGLSVDYRAGKAEDAAQFAPESFALIVAGQCWHWFEREKAAANAFRWLAPGGALVIAHFDWLPLPGNVVAATEALILRHNPAWAMGGGSGFYPGWASDLSGAGFLAVESLSFDVAVPYSHEAWRGRIRASAGVSASLSPHEVDAFDADHAAMLKREFPLEPLEIPHRCWAVWGRKPKG
jgi:SAM-dependent methyltransferase